mmetsp:Transcript_27563/g.31600  ORF Transcript_27563/g.31600 Transcript_27563/m.31600 type:complete len:133 (+) Transcript_27563:603-1001(+)
MVGLDVGASFSCGSFVAVLMLLSSSDTLLVVGGKVGEDEGDFSISSDGESSSSGNSSSEKDIASSLLSLSPSLSSVTGIIVTNTIGVIITIITTVIIARINNDFGNDQYQSNHQDIHLINGRELYHEILASS